MDKITIRNKKIFKVNKYQQDSINKFIETLYLHNDIAINKFNFIISVVLLISNIIL